MPRDYSEPFWDLCARRAPELKTIAAAVVTSAILMIAELGHPTFVSDYYQLQIRNVFPDEAIAADGRLVPDLLLHLVFSSVYLPSLFLLLALAAVSLAGLLLVARTQALSGQRRIVALLLLVFHPFLFPHYAYVANRLLMAPAILCAVLAALALTGAMRPLARTAWAALLLTGTLLSHQQAIGVFLVCALFLHVDAILGHRLSVKTSLAYLAAVAATVVAALILYRGALYGAGWLGLERLRVDGMLSIPADFHDVRVHLQRLAALASATLIEPSLYFPATAKWLLLANLAALGIAVYRIAPTPSRGLWHLAAVAFAFCSFLYFAALVYPLIRHARVLPGLAFAWLFVFLLLLKYGGPAARAAALVCAIFWIAGFAIQFNIMHERMAAKNEIDKALTWEIVQRIGPTRGEGGKRKALALVGTLNHRDLPYWPKLGGVFDHGLSSDTQQSVYAFDWSKYRLLAFYLPYVYPSPEQWQRASGLAAASPIWPAAGSVIPEADMITVVLDRPCAPGPGQSGAGQPRCGNPR